MATRKLPTRVTLKHGALYYIEDLPERGPSGRQRQKWHYLCRADAGASAMHEALATLLADRRHLPCSVAGVISSWIVDVAPQRYAAKTLSEYARMCATIKDAFEDFSDIAAVRPTHIAEFIDDRFAGKANSARKYKQLVSLLMQHAIRKGFRDDNPAREVGMQDYRESARSRYLTDDEIDRIRASALDGTRSGEMIVCMIDLALITGQRIGDILDLKWSQVSEVGIVFRPSKVAKSTGAIVPVRMTAQLAAVLNKTRALGKVKGLTVIHTLRGGPLSYSGAHSAWRRATSRAAVENARIHDLRHRALTDAKQQGKNAQALGGHADQKMTDRYIERPSIEWIDPPEIATKT